MLHRSAAFYLAVCAVALPTHGGDLNPPAGPVAATGRFGPRIEINAVNTPGNADSVYKITQPGSYYLGGNVTGIEGKNGIEIASSGVSLDLMGFELLGVTGSLEGVIVSMSGAGLPMVNVHIRNGSVRNWGLDGVNAGFASNSSLCGIFAENNAFAGLAIGEGGLVEALKRSSRTGRINPVSESTNGSTEVATWWSGASAGSSGIDESPHDMRSSPRAIWPWSHSP